MEDVNETEKIIDNNNIDKSDIKIKQGRNIQSKH